MRINKLHIDNFGRLQNLDMAFDGGLNQIFNENGWGKTTLSVFVKAMFFGMGAARDNIKTERKKYMPWQGGNFGGYIDFSCEKGDYRISRTFAKTPEGDLSQLVDLSTNRELDMPKEGLGEWLFGVGKDTFEMTAFFPQLNFTSGVNEQISAGVLGLDKFKYDLANVGQAMTKIKKEIAASKKNVVKQADIDRMKRTLGELQLDLQEVETTLNFFTKQKNQNQIEFARLEKEISQEKQRFETQEKIFASKTKLENDLKSKNEELASMLLSLQERNKVVKEKPRNKTTILAIVVIVLFCVTGAVLGAVNITSWLIAGLICGVGLLGGGVILVLTKKKKPTADEVSESNQLEERISACQAQIELLKANLASFDGIESPDKSVIDEKQAQLFNIKLHNESLDGQAKGAQLQKERIIQDIEKYNDDISSKEEQKTAVEKRIKILECTYDFLSQAKENVSARFVGPINKQLKALLEKFDMRGREYVVDTNFDIKENVVGAFKPFEHSSQGYQDILSFAMRFLLVDQVFKGEKPFIVLDDSFVNLDERNFEKAKEMLSDFAQEYQILYICCNQANKIKKN